MNFWTGGVSYSITTVIDRSSNAVRPSVVAFDNMRVVFMICSLLFIPVLQILFASQNRAALPARRGVNSDVFLVTQLPPIQIGDKPIEIGSSEIALQRIFRTINRLGTPRR
jgi:hypothetical protein